MTIYTVTMEHTERSRVDSAGETLSEAIGKVAALKFYEKWETIEVEWEGGTAHVHGQCEACETFCVTVWEDGVKFMDGIDNYETDGDGILLCMTCWAAHIKDVEAEEAE